MSNSESSPIPGHLGGRHRGGVRHRRDQVVGPGHRRQRHDPDRRRRPERPGRLARRRVRRDEGGRDHLPDRPRHPDLRASTSRQIKAKAAAATPKTVKDVRKALDDKNLDAISIATPNHWHALMTIWGCQAGKDVYVEKPCSHNVHEGRVAVEAARKYDRIVQHGTQSRSRCRSGPRSPSSSSRASTASCSSRAASATSRRGSIGVKPNTDAPDELDFNLWLGPALEHAVQRQLRPLQLALVLGLRQRRHRQPGRPPDGHRPLDDPRRHPAEDASSASAAGSATRTRARRPTPRSPSSTTATPS